MIPQYVRNSAAEIAMIYLGCEIAEEPIGSNRGFWVDMVQQMLGGSGGDAWCMYAVQAWYIHAYGRYPELLNLGGSPLARCPAPGHCYSVWQHAKRDPDLEIIPAAAILVGEKIPVGAPYIRYTADRIGHTGLVISHWQHDGDHEKDVIKTIEGNTNNAIERRKYYLRDMISNNLKGVII